uniref:Desmoplakin SH3 domain-containing protein n=1 Tax=Electrophorus electricus TaxID=8005 RepID=A0AAY5EQT3_ELEEL
LSLHPSLFQDAENEKKKQPLKYQKSAAENLSEAEVLLKDLFLDLDKAKKLKHPQAGEIENDVTRLHERWLKDCMFYREVYEQKNEVGLQPRINWAQVFEQKQKEVNSEAYGPTIADLEKQIAAHNIIHKEIEAYNAQLSPASTSSKQYSNLLWRRHYLSSLYDYMQGCNKEAAYLREEQGKILQQDWSDRMVDPSDVRRRYENFKSNSLLSHESEVNKLQDDGDRLVELQHPAADTIQVRGTPALNEWQKFLNLCICQETHLDNVEDLAPYSGIAVSLHLSVKSPLSIIAAFILSFWLASSLSPLPHRLHPFQAEERPLQRSEQLLADLRKRSTTVAPLKLRRTAPSRSTTVESLCDWSTPKASVSRGEKFNLKSNANNANWDVQSPDGTVKSIPGVCFLIPPPDPEAINKILYLKHNCLICTLCMKLFWSIKILYSHWCYNCHHHHCVCGLAPTAMGFESPKATELNATLDQLDKDLAEVEQGVLNRLRTPLNPTDPAKDLLNRMKEQEVKTAATLQQLEGQKATAQKNLEPLLSQNYNGPVSSVLPQKLSQTKNKQEGLAALNDLYARKANSSLNLENQIKKVDGAVSGFEKQLSKDGAISDAPNAIQNRMQELKPEMQKLAKDLETTEKLCSSLQQGYQEYCPDVRRQEAKVKSLQSRYANVNNQLTEREIILQGVATKNQDFQNATHSLNAFLDNLPQNKITPNDDLPQIIAKQSSQEVSVNRYANAAAENDQLLNQMDLAKTLSAQQQQQQQQQKMVEVDSLQKHLNEETDRRARAENELRVFKDRMFALRSRKGVERVEEKEVLQYYRDPKLKSDLEEFRKNLHEEALKRTRVQSEIEVLTRRITSLETDQKNSKPRLVTREITDYERDPQLDVEASKLKDEISRLMNEVRIKKNEGSQLKTEVIFLEQKKPSIKERVVQKEVVRVEKDPEMLKSVRVIKMEIDDEGERTRALDNDIYQTKSQIGVLEKLIPTLQPKVVTKEVKTVEKDPVLISESTKLRSIIEEERNQNNILLRELNELQLRHVQVEQLKPRVDIKEIINEIYRVAPETEAEIARLRRGLQDTARQSSDYERQISLIQTELNGLRAQKPKTEYKEVVQEVVKEERSPENVREIQKLSDQVYALQRSYNTSQDELNRLKKERDELKYEKSKVETKVVTKDVIKHISDPLLEKEADRLRREVREEAQRRRTMEEMVFDLQNKHILLERQKPEEKVVVQEVLRLEKDPMQFMEVERLGRTLDEEINNRRKADQEVQRLRVLIEDKERTIRESDEKQRRIQVEAEMSQIKSHIYGLENAPPPVQENIVIEEVLKVERDPKLEKLTNVLRTDFDQENNAILRLERDIRNLKLQIEVLQKEKSFEKTVYKEVVRVEKDQAVEAQRSHLRDQVLQQRNARLDLEDEIRRVSEKLERLQNRRTATSQEETSLTVQKDSLLKEKQELQQELKALESEQREISISFQQNSRLMSERSQMNRQKSIKMESDVQRLERDILDEKDRIYKRENIITELQNSLKKEDAALQTRTQEKNVSTRITIVDPETGKDMSPYDAYIQGLIDRSQYMNLEELECDWEEITSVGRDGETSVLQDRKSGKQYSIKNALRQGKVTQYQLQQYRDGKMPISEFALLVAGETKRPSAITSVTSQKTSQSPSFSSNITTSPDEKFPICGVYDKDSDSCFPVRMALARNMIDSSTAQRLLEAQAATGGIVDINSKERYSVQKAADRGLIDSSQLQRLLNAQKACTGVEDPVTKERLSVGEAVQKGWLPKDNAMRYMEAQYLTGGLIDPNQSGRVNITDAYRKKMIDNKMMRELQEEAYYAKDLVDPETKQKLNYKQAMSCCKTDPTSGLPMLPTSSRESVYIPSYQSHRAPPYGGYF